jgi:hypothetical protein
VPSAPERFKVALKNGLCDYPSAITAPVRFVHAIALATPLAFFTRCGYHTVGGVTHLPPDVRALAVPVFAARTDAYHLETVLTEAVIREFAARTRFRVTPGRKPGCRRGSARNDSQAVRNTAYL